MLPVDEAAASTHVGIHGMVVQAVAVRTLGTPDQAVPHPEPRPAPALPPRFGEHGDAILAGYGFTPRGDRRLARERGGAHGTAPLGEGFAPDLHRRRSLLVGLECRDPSSGVQATKQVKEAVLF